MPRLPPPANARVPRLRRARGTASVANTHIEPDQLHSDEAEKLALAAVDAITQLITERRALRGELATKERELMRLRERFTLVRDSYRKLANELVTQLKLFEALEREEPQASIGAQLHWLRGEPRHQSES